MTHEPDLTRFTVTAYEGDVALWHDCNPNDDPGDGTLVDWVDMDSVAEIVKSVREHVCGEASL